MNIDTIEATAGALRLAKLMHFILERKSDEMLPDWNGFIAFMHDQFIATAEQHGLTDDEIDRELDDVDRWVADRRRELIERN